MKAPSLYIPIFAGVFLFSCSSNESNLTNESESFPFEFQGMLQKSGMTTYMYGTHTISDNAKNFALQSTTINLDRYVNKTVVVKGTKISGYPVDGGPELIDVAIVREK